MNIQAPKIFWYTLSLCMLAITSVLCVVTLRATSVTFEAAHTKLQLNQTISKADQMLGFLQKQNTDLRDKYEELLWTDSATNAPTSLTPDTIVNSYLQLGNSATQIDTAQKTLEKLKEAAK